MKQFAKLLLCMMAVVVVSQGCRTVCREVWFGRVVDIVADDSHSSASRPSDEAVRYSIRPCGAVKLDISAYQADLRRLRKEGTYATVRVTVRSRGTFEYVLPLDSAVVTLSRDTLKSWPQIMPEQSFPGFRPRDTTQLAVGVAPIDIPPGEPQPLDIVWVCMIEVRDTPPSLSSR